MLKRKIIPILLIVSLAVSLFAACGGGSSGGGAAPAQQSSAAPASAAEPPKTAVDSTSGKVKVVFWHAMGGRNGECLDKIIADFNASQDKVEVEGQYQGNYDDAITKLRSSAPGTGPDIMQLYDIGTRWMIDSGMSLTMQDFINADNYDISDYEPNILAYYTLDGTLYSMPFNCSSPVIVYNKDALDKAGLDPNTAFVDIDACIATAKTLNEKGGMGVGGSFTNYSWVFEQLIGMQDKDFLDNGNGRAGRATKTIIDENGAGLALLTKWKEIADQPFTDTYGKGTKESKNQFSNGSLGFILDSCSVYVDISSAASFTVGFAPLPKVSPSDAGGTSVGGGSLWLMDNKDDNKAAASWEFIKYATSADVQVEWAMGTGYLPIRKSALENATYQDYMTNVNPGIKVAIESLQNSKPSCAGSVMGVFSQARVIVENEIERMINDPSITPESVLETICTQINAEIEIYNKTN